MVVKIIKGKKEKCSFCFMMNAILYPNRIGIHGIILGGNYPQLANE